MTTPRTPRNTRALSATPWQADLSLRSATPTGPPAADAQDMLQLMRKSRGRMQGNVSFRQVRASPAEWINAYCYVDTAAAALLFELPVPSTEDAFEVLIADLRGCKVCAIYDDSIRTSVLEVLYRKANVDDDDDDDQAEELLYLRPDRQTYFNSWYAAFLCWQSCQIGQAISEPTSLSHPFLRPVVGDEKLRTLLGAERSNAPLRTDRALLLVEGSPEFSNVEFPSNTTATEVFCVIRGNGQLSIHSLKDRRTLATLQLRELPRSAFARLNKSVFGLARTLAIYPQYARSQAACSHVRPMYLSLNYTDSFEMLFVLLRAFALPEYYPVEQEPPHIKQQQPAATIAEGLQGQPQTHSLPNLSKARGFRIEHFLNARINKAKLRHEQSHHQGLRGSSTDFYVELLIDEQIKAKSSVRTATKGDLFWAESFNIGDLPAVLSSLSFRLKKRHLETSGSVADMSDTASIMTSKTGLYVQSVHSALDTTLAQAEVNLSALETSRDIELMLTLKDDMGAEAGALAVKLRRDEHLVLMEEEYDRVSSQLQNFATGLTLDIYERTPLHPAELANRMLNIFQSDGTAEDWLRHLIRDEIYNARRHIRQRSKSTQNLSDPSNDPAVAKFVDEHEVSTRTNEALLLFRGNTLLTRALDSYMRRLGQSYLETTLRVKLQDIADADEECEIDPSRLDPEGDHEANWQRLVRNTKEVWTYIRHSAFNCPLELRRIFRTIKDHAADHYGSVMPSKVFTSVSSFLFLRFFCAAILSPRLFGLLKTVPSPNAQRTYMLVAKSLQGLANMSTFGNKEHWMAPMNTFCSANRKQFESFINVICDVELTKTNPTTPRKGPPTTKNDKGQSAPLNRSPTVADEGYESRPSSSSTVVFSPDGVALPDSRPTSPSDFNTVESLAYAGSFAIDVPLPVSRPGSPDSLQQDETSIDDYRLEDFNDRRALSPSAESTISVGSHQSVASQDTAIYVGNNQRQQQPQPLIRKSLQRVPKASAQSVEPGHADPQTGVGAADDTSTYRRRLGTKDDKTEGTSATSDDEDDAVPPDIPILKDRANSSQRRPNDPAIGQLTRSSTDSSTRSLKLRPSLDLPLNDPLRLILEHLPSHAREGLLSLPGLIDPAKNLALLVNIWLDSVEGRIHRAAAAAASSKVDDTQSTAPIIRELDHPDSKLARFHHACLELKEKAVACRTQVAERSTLEDQDTASEDDGITASNIVVKWVSTAERMEASPHEFWKIRGSEFSPQSSRASSIYTATLGSESLSRFSMSSRDSVDTMRSGSTGFSAAPPPPAISRDPHGVSKTTTRQSKRSTDEGHVPRRGWGKLTGSSRVTSSAQSSRMGYADRNESQTGSVGSSGSDKTSTTKSSTAKSSSSRKSRRKSPERTAEQTAMRKLGWM